MYIHMYLVGNWKIRLLVWKSRNPPIDREHYWEVLKFPNLPNHQGLRRTMPRCPWKCRVQGAWAGGAHFWDGEIPQGSQIAAYMVLLFRKTKAEVSLVVYLKLLETKHGRTATSTSTVPHTLPYFLNGRQSPHRALCTQMHRATMQATRSWQRLQHPNAYSAVWQVTWWIHRWLLSMESCVLVIWLALCFFLIDILGCFHLRPY